MRYVAENKNKKRLQGSVIKYGQKHLGCSFNKVREHFPLRQIFSKLNLFKKYTKVWFSINLRVYISMGEHYFNATAL